MMLGATIDLVDINKAYGASVAVDRVSLSISAGEFVTLLGASGSGKTTTLMMIAGFVEPDAGEIRIGGKDILSLPPERRDLGVVFQSYALFPHFSVYENIAFPLRLRRMKVAEINRRVGEVLSLVDLAEFGGRRISQLSGGQQQRVALARAIVFSPPVLLMDEPLGALDRRLRDQLQIEIKRIQRELGVTVVYVTHDQEEALALSDRIAIMQEGRIAQLGTPDGVYERPNSPFVASFLGESNFIPVRRQGTDGQIVKLVCQRNGGQRLVGRLDPEQTDCTALLAMVRPEAIKLCRSGPGLDNHVNGTIELREFLGPTVRLSVRCKFGELVVRLPRDELDTQVVAGSPVELTWRADDMILFREA
jgi:spermidine/putrescine ABC transporter ATP-binding subunit